MAGTAALWLEADPDLSTDEIVAIAQETSIAPPSDNPAWGASGALDAYAGIKNVLAQSAVSSPGSDVTDSDKGILFQPKGTGRYEVFAAGQPGFKVEVFDMQGRLVNAMTSSEDTLDVDLSALQSGVYVMRATTSRVTKSLKVAVK